MLAYWGMYAEKKKLKTALTRKRVKNRKHHVRGTLLAGDASSLNSTTLSFFIDGIPPQRLTDLQSDDNVLTLLVKIFPILPVMPFQHQTAAFFLLNCVNISGRLDFSDCSRVKFRPDEGLMRLQPILHTHTLMVF